MLFLPARSLSWLHFLLSRYVIVFAELAAGGLLT